ncbi:GNAT family N-acetyltransferase [Pedobacter sp.]|jgi:ribosomal protein S18 acetylase RimI-like enzyme|uniref:GNAT family N-acetyltransferase n=1 Tax=Pedobacter sp. TaxID=1411316 RepID=UPI002B564B92|nr:GNAT family N-acetyltransferase [Pedobacter sp.]HWW39323.1 GNAT family N-acetyltransferase [Pedobacter sp.]
MIKAKRKDKEKIIQILTKAFEQNPRVNDLVKQDSKRLHRIDRLMRYAYNVCSVFGKVLVSDDGKACALILYPDRKQFSLKGVYWKMELLLGTVGFRSALKVLARETFVSKHHERYSYYIWFMGVDSEYVNMGIGTDFMDELIADADRRKRPIYLETHLPQNLAWFEKFGFEVFREIKLDSPLYFLRRKSFHYFLK